MEKKQQLQTIKSYNLANPEEVCKMANVVKNYIVKNNLYVSIAGHNYVMVEGWQFAGGLLGLFPQVKKVENLGDNKWLAQVDIIHKGEVISTGFALCAKAENKKKSFDEYAILSMAQTRAIGKAYRNLIGWIMKLAGYETTPFEEIKNDATIKEITKQDFEKRKEKIAPKVQPKQTRECFNCAQQITNAEADYSRRIFKKQLCRQCQRSHKKNDTSQTI